MNHKLNISLSINPFIEDKDIYIKAFKDYINEDSLIVEHSTTHHYFTKDEMSKFLCSWMSEIRHFKEHKISEQLTTTYCRGLLDNILSNGGIENVRTCFEDKSKDITFTEHLLYYIGDITDNIQEIS